MNNICSVVLEISEGEEDDVSWDDPDLGLASELRVTSGYAVAASRELRAG
jgi:hypothetical protein